MELQSYLELPSIELECDPEQSELNMNWIKASAVNHCSFSAITLEGKQHWMYNEEDVLCMLQETEAVELRR